MTLAMLVSHMCLKTTHFSEYTLAFLTLVPSFLEMVGPLVTLEILSVGESLGAALLWTRILNAFMVCFDMSFQVGLACEHDLMPRA